MDVGVRELKAHLSAYLDRAARGEVITVTDRGRPTAVLGPVPGRVGIDRGIEEGWVTPPTRPAGLRSIRRQVSARRVADVLDEDRSE